MKTTFVLLTLIVTMAAYCQDNKQSFSVYEVVDKKEVNTKLIQSLEASEFIIDKDEKSPFIAFFLASSEKDALKILAENSDNGLTLLPSKQTFGESMDYKGVVAVQNKCGLNANHIKKTKADNNKVEVYLDYPGAKIWTGYTADVKGKKVAFVIDNYVYDMPMVIDQIKIGVLIINDFSNKEEALKYARLLKPAK